MHKNALVLATFIAVAISFSVFAQDIPRPAGWVNDFAEVLSPETEKALSDKIQAYKDATGIEMAVVTVPSLQGYTVEQFTLQLAEKWGVGNKEKDNGLVFLLAPNERRVRIEVGYGLEGDLTDGRAGSILDESAVPYLKKNDWNGGVSATVDSLLSYLGQKTYQARESEKAALAVARENERKEAQQRREKEWAMFLSFLSYAVPLGLVITAVFFVRRWYVNYKRLRALQDENESVFQNVICMYEDVCEKMNKAFIIVSGLREKGNTLTFCDKVQAEFKDSVINYRRVINDLKIWYVDYRRAEEVQLALEELGKDLNRTEQKADELLGLPALIKSEKHRVTTKTDEIEANLKASDSQFTAMIPRLDKAYQGQISMLSMGAGENIRKLKEALSKPRKDWLYLSGLLTLAERSSKRMVELMNQYDELVEKTKREKDSDLEEIERLLQESKKAIANDDVEDSTKDKFKEAVKSANLAKSIKPDKDQQWMLLRTLTIAAITSLRSVKDEAIRDIDKAEDRRRAARRREEESERYSSSSSYSSGSSGSSGGFGGGSFGGGGASRGF